MIYVSQGHELGIGLEVFFKSITCLPQIACDKIMLVANTYSIQKSLNSIDINDFKISDNSLEFLNKKISIQTIKDSHFSQSCHSLTTILENISKNDILITLPTSKDQLIHNDKNQAGYTQFFRSYYSQPNLIMIFKGLDNFFLLLTDHIPLKDVSQSITKSLCVSKLKTALISLENYQLANFKEIIFSGINPHAGEGGILGNEDAHISDAIDELKSVNPKYHFKGPYPGDTLHFSEKKESQLFVYSFHDQALSLFKKTYGLFGINITLGLPFLRMSVDHGTAFELYGKNKADPTGCLYVIKEALKLSLS